MVATSEESKPEENKESTDAKEAKAAADPVKDDPAFMPNIVPQTGEGGKASSKKEVDSGLEPNPHDPVNSPQASNPTVMTGENE